MHKILVFGKEDCKFAKKAIASIRDNSIFIPIEDDYQSIDEPFKSIIKANRHVTSPCIFRIKYLGGNKDLIEFHKRWTKKNKDLGKNDYVIFGRDSCPYTIDSLDKMDSWGLYYQYIRVNSVPNDKMASYYHEIASKLRHRTAPCIFIVEYIGTCANLIKLNEIKEEKERIKLNKHKKAVEQVEEMYSQASL